MVTSGYAISIEQQFKMANPISSPITALRFLSAAKWINSARSSGLVVGPIVERHCEPLSTLAKLTVILQIVNLSLPLPDVSLG